MSPHAVNIIIDAQGFRDECNNFVFKEAACIGFTNAGYVLLTLQANVSSPKPFKDVHCRKTRRTALWLSKFHHFKLWNNIGISYTEMMKILSVFDNITTNVFVKGSDKIQWFSNVFKKASIIDLTNYNCPSLKQLRVEHGFESSNSLALNNVKSLFSWMRIRAINCEEPSQIFSNSARARVRATPYMHTKNEKEGACCPPLI